MTKKTLLALMCFALCIAFVPAIALANDLTSSGFKTAAEVTDPEPVTPTNVQAKVDGMEKGTMKSVDGQQLNGTIASVSVTFDKQACGRYFVTAMKKNHSKVSTGNMPFIGTTVAGAGYWDEESQVYTGPNGEKITYTDKTLTVQLKVCKFDTAPQYDHMGYSGNENIVIAVAAESNTLMKQSDLVTVEIPFTENSKGKTFTPEGEQPAEKIAIASASFDKASFPYNGKTQKPTVKTVKDVNGKVVPSSGYTVTYSNAKSQNVGSYKVTVTGTGNYEGSASLTYKITVSELVTLSKIKIKSLEAGEGTVAVNWNKLSKQKRKKVAKVEVQYSTSKKFTKKTTKTKRVSSKKSSMKLKNLKSGKRYYFRLRAYTADKNAKYVSKWSAIKSTKVQ